MAAGYIISALIIILMLAVLIGVCMLWAAAIYIPADMARKRGYSFVLWILYSCVLTVPALVHIYFFRKDNQDGILHNLGEYKCPNCSNGMGKAADVLHKAEQAAAELSDDELADHILQARCPKCNHSVELDTLSIPLAPRERGLMAGVIIAWIVAVLYWLLG